MSLASCAAFARRTSWEDLPADVRQRSALLVLDTLGCALSARREGAHASWVDALCDGDAPAQSTVWGTDRRLSASEAALVNATIAHHLDWDDGNPRASVHGGATIVPAALACAERVGCSGREFLTTVAVAYAVAVACGRPLLDGIERHGLHPPAVNGVFGTAAAAARLLGCRDAAFVHALTLAGTLAPIAPFHAFTAGAPVKDLYAGWPAFVGVTAAELAMAGLEGSSALFNAPGDGLGWFLAHQPVEPGEPELDELRHIAFKAYPSCRATHMVLTALESMLPVAADQVDAIRIETYPAAARLSADADPTSPIGAKVSLPFCVASMVIDGELTPSAFRSERLRESRRTDLMARVSVVEVSDRPEDGGRVGRVMVTGTDGRRRISETRIHKWSAGAPATASDVRAKFAAQQHPRGSALLAAVDALPDAPDVSALLAACSASQPA